jgi:hypothetical protein
MMQPPFVPQDLPAEVAHAATVSQLGPLNNIYKPRISSPLAVIAIALGIIVADIIVFALILVLTGFVLSLLVIVPIAAIIYGIYGLTHYKLRVYVFAAGLIYANDGRIDTVRWEQIAAVWQKQRRRRYRYSSFGIVSALIFRSNTRESYTLQRHDGFSISISSAGVSEIQQLGQTIQYEVTRIQAPHAIATFDSGQPIPFGPFILSQQGIAKNNGTILPWQQFAEVTRKNGSLAIKQTGKMLNWGAAPMDKIPNLNVFHAVIEHAQRSAPNMSYPPANVR